MLVGAGSRGLRVAQQLSGRRLRRVQGQSTRRRVRPGHRSRHGAVRAERAGGLRADVHGQTAVRGTGDRFGARRTHRPKLFPPRENMPFVVVDQLPRTPRIVGVEATSARRSDAVLAGTVRDRSATATRARARASYSLAAAPRPDGELTLQVTRIDGGSTSRWMHDDLEAGRRGGAPGPYGTFVGDPTVETPVLCLAAGSGLAPILALADAALRRGFALPVTLLFSARTRETSTRPACCAIGSVAIAISIPHHLYALAYALDGGSCPGAYRPCFLRSSPISRDTASSSREVRNSSQTASIRPRRWAPKEHLMHTEGYYSQRGGLATVTHGR